MNHSVSLPEHERSQGARPEAEVTETDASQHVRQIFGSIAPTYDRLNHLLSLGLDRHWWRRAAESFREILVRPEARILDICCGTGDMTAALMNLRPAAGHPVVGLDFSSEMLANAQAKYRAANVQWVEGDAMALPYPDASFDLVTAAFGFRNLANYAAGLAEIRRVLRPGGSIGILECNQPDGVNGLAYNVYFQHVLPLVGGWISGDRAAYRYLPASVERFPRPPRMLRLMLDAGFTACAWDAYLFRAAGLYRGVRR